MMHPVSWLALGVLSIATAISSPSAHAVSRGIDRATGQALWNAAVHGKTTTIGGGNGSMKVIRPTGANGTPTSAAGGGATVTDQMRLPVGGLDVPVSGKLDVSKGDIVGAIAGCLTGGIVGCAIGVATPLAAAFLLSGDVRQNAQTGIPEVKDPTVCTREPCYQYQVNVTTSFPWASTKLEACEISLPLLAPYWPAGYTFTNPRISTDGKTCWYTLKTNTGAIYADPAGNQVIQRSVPAGSPTWYPATPQEVKDALYKNDPPPGIIDELSRYGNIIWPGPVTVTGPSEMKGPKTTTIGTDGNKSTTTTSETRTPLSYDGPSVTAGTPTTTKTTTTTTTNPDGSTSTSTGTETTTTTEGDTPEASPEEAAPSDTALPELPKLYKRKYPEGMTGIWDARKAELMSSPLMSLKDSLLPSVGGGGACPTWSLPVNVAWVDFGTYNVAPPCWIWDFGKVIIVLSAMFLARALVFGG